MIPGLSRYQGLAAFAGLLAIIAASRVLLIPDGPWEQDEAILATGVLDYNLTLHRPHPPGFPGFIALGKLLYPLTGDALLSLRLWSCVASVVTFVLAAALLAPLVGAWTALAVALLYAFLPGVWAHAPRAFSTTPAIALALLSVWLAARRDPKRTPWAWAALAGSALVRPQLAPVLGVLAIIGVVRGLREDRRATVLGLALACGLVVTALGVMVIDTGGLGPTLAAFREHATHAFGVERSWPAFADLGIVRALGGPIAAIVWAAISLVGLLAIVRQHPDAGLGLFALTGVALWTVLVLHNPERPRYCLPVIIITLPAIAVALRLAGQTLGTGVVLLAALAAGAVGAPAVFAMHGQPLPTVAAVRALAAEADREQPLVHGHGVFSFVRYAHFSGALTRPIVDASWLHGRKQRRALALLSRPFAYLGGPKVLPGATVSVEVYDDFPMAAWDLSQRRYDRTQVVRGLVLRGAGTHALEHNSRDESYAWLGQEVALVAQPGASTLNVILQVDGRRAPQEVVASVEGSGEVLRATLRRGVHRVRAPLPNCEGPCEVVLRFSNVVLDRRDRRALAARLYGAWCEGPELETQAYTWSPGRPFEARAHGVELEGVFQPERFTRERVPGAWTNGHVVASFPARPGTLRVTLAQPPPRSSAVTLRTRDGTFEIEAGGRPGTHEIPNDRNDVRLEIIGEASSPASRNPSSRDQRELGPILFSVEVVPAG